MANRRLTLLILLAAPILGATLPASAQSFSFDEPEADLSPGQYLWTDDETGEGPLAIVVSIPLQRLHVYRGQALIGVASVSTGKRGHGTPLGAFQILQKNRWHRSNLYSNAPMPFMQRLTWDGVAIHAGYNPGFPASHGCIRMPPAFARRLFDMTALGVNVLVTDGAIAPPYYLPFDTYRWASFDTGVTGGYTETPRYAAAGPHWLRFSSLQSAAFRLDYSASVFLE
jgi:hypothetical protein